MARDYQAKASGAGPPGPGKISSSAFNCSGVSLIVQRVDIVLELLHRARSDDRRGDGGLRQQPRQRDIGGMLAQFLAEVLVALDLVVVLFDILAEDSRWRGVLR